MILKMLHGTSSLNEDMFYEMKLILPFAQTMFSTFCLPSTREVVFFFIFFFFCNKRVLHAMRWTGHSRHCLEDSPWIRQSWYPQFLGICRSYIIPIMKHLRFCVFSQNDKVRLFLVNIIALFFSCFVFLSGGQTYSFTVEVLMGQVMKGTWAV